jgi:AraC-like DNA-binding protein
MQRSRITRIDFARAKYGHEVLIDLAWVSEMPTFVHTEPHVLTFYEILLVTQGRGTLWLDSHQHTVRPGTVFFISPGQVRRWDVQQLNALCLFFAAEFLGSFIRDDLFLQRLPYFHISAAAAAMRPGSRDRAWLRSRLLDIRCELRTDTADGIHLMRARLYEVLIVLARQFSRVAGVPSERVPCGLTVRYQRLLTERSSGSHRVADYARELGVTAGYLNRLCLAHLGYSAKSVMAQHLATQGIRQLLYSDSSVAQIARQLGFLDPSHFTRFFRRITGRAPSYFR